MGRIRALPSPALVVALLALVVGITGAAIAKGGKSVTKKQAKNIASNQIAAKAPGLSVAHSASAGTADRAGKAGDAEAVNGQRAVKVFAKLPSPTSTPTTIANLGGGFELTATCTGGSGADVVLAFTPSIAVEIQAQFIGDTGPDFVSDQTVGPATFDLTGSNHRGETTFSAATTSGTVASGSIGFDDPSTFNLEIACAFYGEVLEG